MKVITAVEPLVPVESTSVFLGGGIQKCPPWQSVVLAGLEHLNCTVYNPRRPNFPIDDPNETDRQIDWEFDALNVADVFTMWFCNADSDQPICLYELGRHLALRYGGQFNGPLSSIVIGVEPGYRRSKDVYRQTYRVCSLIKIIDNLNDHIQKIRDAVISHPRYTLAKSL